MKIGYICDNCKESSSTKTWIFNCIECNKEICEQCMFGLATCKECANKHPKEFLERRFYEN